MKTTILPLSDSQAVLETVGGKGASLARLANAQLPVPGGFHITTEAYRLFINANDLQPGIDEALEAADTAQPATLETASQAISHLFAQAEIPGDLAGAIMDAYINL
jgi:rifampicin phosphotransferase